MIVAILSSCSQNNKSSLPDPTYDYKIVVISGCEYIEVDAGFGYGAVYSLTHKGNCINPIHPRNTP